MVGERLGRRGKRKERRKEGGKVEEKAGEEERECAAGDRRGGQGGRIQELLERWKGTKRV